MTEWISVEDRLPAHTGYDNDLNCKLYPFVLMYITNIINEYGTECAIGAYDVDNEEWFYADYSDSGMNGVTHWQPLPEPPID